MINFRERERGRKKGRNTIRGSDSGEKEKDKHIWGNPEIGPKR